VTRVTNRHISSSSTQQLTMLTRSVFRAVRQSSRVRFYSASNEFDSLVSGALKKANISSEDDISKLATNNINSLDTLRSMSPEDFNQIGVTVGSRIAIQQALNGAYISIYFYLSPSLFTSLSLSLSLGHSRSRSKTFSCLPSLF
jgi:hypothetical protein